MNLPNKITLIRLLLIPFFMAAFMLQMYGDYFAYISAGIFLAAALTDFLDGYIARKRNLVTDMGKFLDPIADKVLVAAALFLILGFGLVPPGWGVIFVTVIIAREFAVSALRMVAASKGKVIAADKTGKLKTAVTMGALAAMLVARPLDDIINPPYYPAVVGFKPPPTIFETAWNNCFPDYYVFQWAAFGALAFAVLLTVISGVGYIVKNRGVFANDK